MGRSCILEWLLLCILSVSECTIEVNGIEGQNVTLPCRYDAKYKGPQHTCWGKGTIPIRGCSDQIISTDGTKVKHQVSSRYQLIGDLITGDVSLTIFNTSEKDSGIYGCRVEHAGWFNDEKFEVTLTVNKTPAPPTSRTPDYMTTTSQTWGYHTHDYLTENSSPCSDTFSTHYITSELIGFTNQVGILVSILLVLIGVVILSAHVLRKQWKRDALVLKIPQNSGDTVGYRSSESSPVQQAQEVAIENIYQTECVDRVDYEECP
ncbi:hepatitis A virus cellular receptor 1 homolog isoform X2 [Esox lucius]|uniref:hepatitis A virus cellular receptor 1 homolog isoform X2 n=1 Tax=Esox lucius TaxID=8010 RepID=UPI001476D1E3|nr:hepatitis A virus cellular receptor 1 homolog isoform X2 [Esox lucius]